ncbi:hypothetical protein INT45_007142 [Circinella minor]|uniref:Zinc finger FYVE domain-containing protein 19 n=1 Tax=Circinella minor TaxID=1195481 RepID=A0A8H7VG47_9FUNG|nr:hypothetical protein INT45_007142 [Circinella minor]
MNDNDNDLAKRVAQLKEEKEVKETFNLISDEELAQRFENVFSSQQQPVNKYVIPSDTDMDEVEKLLQDVDLLNSDEEEEEQEQEDDNVLNYTEKKRKQNEKMKEITKTFLGVQEGKEDIILDNESNELLNQIKDQVNVEKKYSHLDKQRELDLEKRYLELKQNPPHLFTISSTQQDNNKQRFPGPPPKPIQENEFHDEMDDWCIICNEDATIECKGCDNDRFCDPCWFDGHRSDMADYEAMKHKFNRLTS